MNSTFFASLEYPTLAAGLLGVWVIGEYAILHLRNVALLTACVQVECCIH